MRVINEQMPSDPKQIEEMLQKGPDGPVFMVNLLKFKEKAEYEDGRPTDLSGREAYGLYGAVVATLIPRYGGQLVFAADVTFLAVGQVEELWDEIAVVAYPSRGDLLKMTLSDEWRDASVHRTAGLAGQLNIESVLQPGLDSIPWVQLLVKEISK